MTNEEEIQFLCQVLQHPAGFDLGFAGILSIRTTDNNTIEVEWIDKNQDEQYQSFDRSEMTNAVKFFVEYRHEHQLGLDYEINLLH